MGVAKPKTTDTVETVESDAGELEPGRFVERELWVMATINMAGLHVGEIALVDPTVDYIANALEHRFLISVDAP